METQALQPKQVYYQDSNFRFEFERMGNLVVIHYTSYVWKPSVLKKAYSVFKTFLMECTENNITDVMTVTPNPKFAHLFGGTTTTTVVHKGQEYEVIKWDLKSEPL
jgi:hypothetical protein